MTSETELTDELIQAYVTGTLDPGAAAQIDEAAKTDPELAAELAIWRSARAVQADAVAKAGASEFGWARIERAIQTGEVRRNANDNPVEKPFWSRPMFAPWQAAAAAVFALIGWQAVVSPMIGTAGEGGDATYTLAGEVTGQDFAFRVAFIDNARASDIESALRGVEARIVDGPSAIGFYTIAFDDPETMAAARNELSSDTNEIVAETAGR